MKTFAIVLGAIVATLLLALTAAFFALRATLAPLPGGWSVPLTLGPLTMQADVPSMIRLATSTWAGPLMQGRHLSTRHGQLRFSWGTEGALHVQCAPCELVPAGMGEEPLRIDGAGFTVHRLGESLSGHFTAGGMQGDWRGRMTSGGMQIHVTLPATPIAQGYALFEREIPELTHARIEGTFTLHAELLLPAGTWSARPTVEGFAVSGLGTEALAGARSSCTRRTSRLTAEGWLSRAVVAAEDQRFYEHPGYDLVEIAASLSRNQESQRIARGASTLSQQAARLLVTGGERKPMRKLRELLYAVEMERTLGKARILRLYLDNAPWGQGLCGAESAAQNYFGVRAHELTAPQAAWLAAMLHNPDMEAQRWADTGTVDTARVEWVLLGMRGMSRRRKLELAGELPLMDWKPWWAPPAAR